MESWIEFARGPLFLFAFVFMALGLLRRAVLTGFDVVRAMHRAGDKILPKKSLAWATLKWLVPIGKLNSRPVQSLSSFSFHVAILIVPLFLSGHILLWERTLGFGWPAIHNTIADWLTLVAIATALLLVVLRATSRATRSLSRPQDYIIPLLVILPFASGYLLMHPALNPFAHNGTLLFHALSADLVLFLMPITKLSHAALIPSVQIVSEVGWHFPADAGSQVATTLGKQGDPV